MRNDQAIPGTPSSDCSWKGSGGCDRKRQGMPGSVLQTSHRCFQTASNLTSMQGKMPERSCRHQGGSNATDRMRTKVVLHLARAIGDRKVMGHLEWKDHLETSSSSTLASHWGENPPMVCSAVLRDIGGICHVDWTAAHVAFSRRCENCGSNGPLWPARPSRHIRSNRPCETFGHQVLWLRSGSCQGCHLPQTTGCLDQPFRPWRSLEEPPWWTGVHASIQRSWVWRLSKAWTCEQHLRPLCLCQACCAKPTPGMQLFSSPGLHRRAPTLVRAEKGQCHALPPLSIIRVGCICRYRAQNSRRMSCSRILLGFCSPTSMCQQFMSTMYCAQSRKRTTLNSPG